MVTGCRGIGADSENSPFPLQNNPLTRESHFYKKIIRTLKNQGSYYLCMVGAVRLELMTSCMSSMRSNQLSYVPEAFIYYHIFFYFTSE